MRSLHQLLADADNDAVSREYFLEAASNWTQPDAPVKIRPGTERTSPVQIKDPPYLRVARRRGQLHPQDPIQRYQAKPGDVNIVWITGMYSGIWPGTGKFGQLLRPLGYNVQVVKTWSDAMSAGLGRVVRHIPSQSLKSLHSRIAQAHIQRNQEKLGEEMPNEPDVIIGSSQGGAIAISIAPVYKNARMILLCPAWKIFGVTPAGLRSDTIIFHGVNDRTVPFADSQELARMTGAKLIPLEDGHIIQNGFRLVIAWIAKFAATALQDKQGKQESFVPQNVNLWLV